MEIVITELSPCQKPEALALIETSGLRPEYVLAEGTRYWGAFLKEQLTGIIGCEYEGKYALLRSALVLEPYRRQGIAAQLTQTLLQAAMDSGLAAVYLFSTDAGDYWLKMGFHNIPVAEAVQKLPNACQVRLFEALGWLPTEVAYRYDL